MDLEGQRRDQTEQLKQMAKLVDIYVEAGAKRVFAGAIEWPLGLVSKDLP